MSKRKKYWDCRNCDPLKVGDLVRASAEILVEGKIKAIDGDEVIITSKVTKRDIAFPKDCITEVFIA